MADIRQVTEDFAVAPQIDPEDFAALAGMGFKAVINNRPDGEAGGQMPSAVAEEKARAAGLTYVHAPFVGQPSETAIAALQEALAGGKGPVLAYCRSGTRSITAWAIAQAQSGALGPDVIVEKALAAGYDLSPLKGFLRSLSSNV